MMRACAIAPLSTVKMMYEYGADNYDLLQSVAASDAEGRVEVMEYFLDKGADIDAVMWKHHRYSYEMMGALGLGTALHAAARGGFADRVGFLIERGARTDVLDSMGMTVLQVAEAYKRGDVVAVLKGSAPAVNEA